MLLVCAYAYSLTLIFLVHHPPTPTLTVHACVYVCVSVCAHAHTSFRLEFSFWPVFQFINSLYVGTKSALKNTHWVLIFSYSIFQFQSVHLAYFIFPSSLPKFFNFNIFVIIILKYMFV